VLYRRRIQKNKERFDSILRDLKKEENTIQEKHTVKPNTINDETVEKILHGLQKFEEKKLFLHKNCNINFVAKKAHTNKTYLSKTLQVHKKKKFFQYITDLRIEYALIQLKNDSKFRAYDIKSIADELGFNTSESFAKAFKKRTGIYPSFYIKNLNKLNS
jgi:AraC-like DNA-binding protein